MDTQSPNSEPLLQQSRPEKPSGKHHLIFSFIGLAVLLAVSGAAYYWQHQKVNQQSATIKTASAQLQNTKSQNLGLKSTLNSLENQLATEKKQISSLETSSQEPASSSSTTSTTSNYQDPDFVAIAPDSGNGTEPGSVTFSWTPQKYATYYILEIKVAGQADYPSNPNQDQYVKFSSTQDQPSTITLNYSFNPPTQASYAWRVTAHAIVNGTDTALQSTPDNNLTIF